MYTERMAIQDELHDNRRQIQDLRERNGDLLKRLREIDERDMGDEVSYDGLNSLTTSLTEILGRLSELIPSVSPAAIIEHIANQVDSNIIIESTVKKEPEPTRMEQAVQASKLHMPTPKAISKEQTASIMKEIIGEFGTIKTSELEKEFYKRTGKKYANFSEQIRQAMDVSSMIERAGHGRYKLSKPSDPKEAYNNMVKSLDVEKEKDLVVSM